MKTYLKIIAARLFTTDTFYFCKNCNMFIHESMTDGICPDCKCKTEKID